MSRFSFKYFLPFLLAAGGVHAEWVLDGETSSFYYVTSKASALSELNSFHGLSGGISDGGEATLSIALDSVDTAIDVRNQRMRDIVFQVADYPAATVTVQVDASALAGMAAGSTMQGSYEASVDLHGFSQILNADLQVLKLNANTVQIQPARPLIVGAASFGLAEGVEELREIAGLPSINPNVVIDFTLVYHIR